MQTQDEAAGTGAGAVGIARLGYVGNQVLSDSDEHAMDIDTELRIEQDIANEPRAGCAKDEAWEVNGEAGSQHESVPGGKAESSGSSEASTTGRGGGGHVDDEASASNEDDGNNKPTALPQPPPILPSAHIPGTRFRDPPGKWFKRRDEDGAGPQQQMLQHANSAGHAFKAACDYWAPDKSSGTGHKTVKGYVSYPDAGSLLNIALLPSDVRFLYELIPEGAACKLHLDIEWECYDAAAEEEAINERRMKLLLKLLQGCIKDSLGIEPRFVVLEGSRLVDKSDGESKVLKFSYHVVSPNVVFASNTGGMKAFADRLVQICEGKPDLWWVDSKGKHRCIVDTSIYTTNRCLRTELSCKLSDPTTTTLQRVRLDKDGTWRKMPNLTEQDYLDAFVTHIDDSFDRSKIIPDTPGCGSASKKQRKQSLTATKSDTNDNKKLRRADDSEDLAKVVKILQDMVDAKGGSGCIVVCPLPATAAGEGGGVFGNGGFQCRNNGDRRCLVTPGEFHASNNCYLTVDPEGNVRYSCLAGTCKAKRPMKIGVLVEEDDNSNDEVSAAPAAATTSKEAEAAESSGDDDSEVFPRRPKQTAAGTATNNDSVNRKKAKRLIVEDEGEAIMTLGEGPGAGIPESGGGSSGKCNNDFETPEAGFGGGSSGGGDDGGGSGGGSDDYDGGGDDDGGGSGGGSDDYDGGGDDDCGGSSGGSDDYDGGGDDDDGSGGGGSGPGGDDLAALEEGGNELALQAIRELALMGPPDSLEDAASIMSAAAECAGRGCCSDACFRDLVGAVMEAVLCRPGLAGGMDNLAELTERMEAWRPPHGSPGSRDALAKLRFRRLRFPVVGLKHDVVQDPQMSSDPESLAAASFLRNVDMQRTDPRTLVLVVRLLWPEARGEARAFLERNVSDMGSTLDVVWETGTSFASDAFTSSLMSHLKLSIQAHPFVRSAIPGLMEHSVLSFDKLDDGLKFSLDDGCVPSERANYVLDYYTGEIVGSKGMGVVRRLFGMKRFFTGDGDAILMAEVLADLGIGSRMRYDTSAGGWRICDSQSNIWRLPKAEHEVEAVVGGAVERELKPLKELESFRGVEFDWYANGTRLEECNDDVGDSASVCTAVSKRSRGRGGGGKRRRSMISSVLHAFSQKVKNVADVLKMLQQHILLDFSKKQEKHLLCCANGIVDLRHGKILGPPTPDQFITQICPVEYDPSADLKPAIDFFEQLFPIEEYPDMIELVSFMQQFISYGLTLETNLQFCLYVYGRGSNCKSVLMRALIEILGGMLCRTIPIESLSKPRGTNNDSLKGAKDTRLVLISESNRRAKIDVGTYNAVVCGEETTTKGMYKKEINFIPVMKLMFFLNDLPEWKTSDGSPLFHILRRNAYLRLKKMYLDPGRESDQKIIEELRSLDKEYLIGKKDTSYYENHVEGHQEAFLHFFVLGAVAYYAAGKRIPIPKSMQLQAKAETFSTVEAVEEFVSDWLRPSYGETQLVKELYEKFLIVFPDSDRDLYALAAFGRDLAQTIREKKSQPSFGPDGWGAVTNENIRKNRAKGSGWKNLVLLESVNQ